MDYNHTGNVWEKRMVYVVTVWLREEDEEGEPLNWSSPSEEFYADTLEEAEQMKERFLSGQDGLYGDLIEEVWISDEKEERELFKEISPRTQESQLGQSGSSVLQKLADNKKHIENRNASDTRRTSKQIAERGERQSDEAR